MDTERHDALTGQLIAQVQRKQNVRRLGLSICNERLILPLPFGREATIDHFLEPRLLIGRQLVALKFQIVESDRGEAMTVTGDVDDSCALGGLELAENQIGKEKVTDVVCGELQLDAVFGHGALW